MKEYIEREAVIQEIMNAQESLESNIDKEWTKNKPCFKGLAWANRIILDAQAADVEPVRHGEWIKGEENSHRRIIECSHCKTGFVLDNSETNPNYCPNCGARMDGGNSNG